MIDINLIRQNPDLIREAMEKLGDDTAKDRIDDIIALDLQRRELLTKSETLQAARNRLNKKMGPLRGNKKLDDSTKAALMRVAANAIAAGNYEDAERFMDFKDMKEGALDTSGDADVNVAMGKLVGELKQMSDVYGGYQDRIREVETELDEHMLWIPNLPHETTPFGEGDEDNVPWEPEGNFRTFDFDIKPHWEIGETLNVIDFERGIKLHGSRGYVLRGWGARLQRALIAFFLDHAREHGFTEYYVPFMVLPEMLEGSAQFPKFRDTVYEDRDAGFVMIPTSEVALTNLHRDEILEEADLPLYYTAHTPCFRRERMSAGSAIRGIKRVHQFEKVEMFKFTTPENSYDELESLTETASDIARKLDLPFRRLVICSGDLGFSATKKYDIEIYAPGSDEWLEVSSCSNTEAFQARRANIRFRPEGGGKNDYVHTLNGSGLATPRVMIAIVENYQRADGGFDIPEVLRPYMGVDAITPGM
ncbi:MAG: serine--tRNA ligase [Chloroflexota bacterium]